MCSLFPFLTFSLLFSSYSISLNCLSQLLHFFYCTIILCNANTIFWVLKCISIIMVLFFENMKTYHFELFSGHPVISASLIKLRRGLREHKFLFENLLAQRTFLSHLDSWFSSISLLYSLNQVIVKKDEAKWNKFMRALNLISLSDYIILCINNLFNILQINKCTYICTYICYDLNLNLILVTWIKMNFKIKFWN